MFNILINFWYIWLLVLVTAVYRVFKPTIKGWFGEKMMAGYLSRLPEEYTVLNDVILPTETGTTQIDHIVVSPYGVFVIETKLQGLYSAERNRRSGLKTSMERKTDL